MTTDDGSVAEDGTVPGPPDPQTMLLAEGQAALVLAESILMALLNNGLLSKDDVNEALETVIDTKRRMLEEGQQPAPSRAAIGILSSIANSLAALK
jgi:hypothetical protein